MRPLIGVTPDLHDGRYSVRVDYLSALSDTDCDAVVLSFDQDYHILDRLNGVVISGGDDIHPSFYGEKIAFDMKIIDRRRTEFETGLFRECVQKKMPMLGICNGIQLMNVALDGTLYQDIGNEVPLALDHKSGYHTITMFDEGFLPAGDYTVNTSHHQSIKRPGRGIRIIAESADGIIESITVDGHPFAVGVQWHPEKDMNNPVNAVLFEKFREACCAT